MSEKLENIVKAAEKFDQEERKKGNSPPLIQQKLFISKVKEFCQKLGADEGLALVGAYLMDIKIGQAVRERRIKDHIEMSLQAARDFLKKFSLSRKTLDKIENIIKAHHATIPYKCPEAEIVANADCFKFLHPRGATLFLVTLGKRGSSFKEALDYLEQKVEEKHKVISLDVCRKEANEYYRLLKKLISLAKKPL